MNNEIETKAREIAAKHAFTYAGNFGRGEFEYTVKVSGSEGTLYLTAACNAQISEKRAQEELSKVWEEVKALVVAEFPGAKKEKTRGHYVWRIGFTHMSRFCTEGFRRGVRAC